MALRKSELYSSLWSSCDELRGGMDASQYKDYVLVMLFIKYVSDKYADVPFARLAKPLALCRITLITTAAPYRADRGDQGPGAPYNAAAKFYEVYSGDTAFDHDRVRGPCHSRRHDSRFPRTGDS